jgi:hypothetical protein
LRITVEKENVSKTVPLEKIFYFYDGIGKYTGKNAASLREFAEKVNEVDEKSLEFHLQRRDFENWISEALKEDELAKQISEIRESNTTGRELRERLYLIVSRRLEQLTKTTARVSNASTSVSSKPRRKRTEFGEKRLQRKNTSCTCNATYKRATATVGLQSRMFIATAYTSC